MAEEMPLSDPLDQILADIVQIHTSRASHVKEQHRNASILRAAVKQEEEVTSCLRVNKVFIQSLEASVHSGIAAVEADDVKFNEHLDTALRLRNAREVDGEDPLAQLWTDMVRTRVSRAAHAKKLTDNKSKLLEDKQSGERLEAKLRNYERETKEAEVNSQKGKAAIEADERRILELMNTALQLKRTRESDGNGRTPADDHQLRLKRQRVEENAVAGPSHLSRNRRSGSQSQSPYRKLRHTSGAKVEAMEIESDSCDEDYKPSPSPSDDEQ
ncbi:hypothetical protein C8R43DRAFT_1243394 [Mycena crocata]|nr:hypothetical protein C8R43DRAFT_1243394 [Mycena crocata]